MLLIPIQPVPSQQLSVILANQNCRIAIYLLNDDIFVDLNSGGVDMSLGVIARNGVPLDSSNSYDGFQGNLYFIDLQGLDDPVYTGLGTRWVLIYLTAAEVALTQTPIAFVPAGTPILTLSETLLVTASAPGNFSVPHGLGVTPFIIDIIATDPETIWGQATFGDPTNVNLVASDTGATAKVLIYTVAAAGLAIQPPAETLLVNSPAPGNFTVAHGLGEIPSLIEFLPTSLGFLWETADADAMNVYLAASDVGVSASLTLFDPVLSALNVEGPVEVLIVTSPGPGNFTVPHNLITAPSRIKILQISAGVICAQTPNFDTTNLNLTATDVGVVARILIYA